MADTDSIFFVDNQCLTDTQGTRYNVGFDKEHEFLKENHPVVLSFYYKSHRAFVKFQDLVASSRKDVPETIMMQQTPPLSLPRNAIIQASQEYLLLINEAITSLPDVQDQRAYRKNNGLNFTYALWLLVHNYIFDNSDSTSPVIFSLIEWYQTISNIVSEFIDIDECDTKERFWNELELLLINGDIQAAISWLEYGEQKQNQHCLDIGIHNEELHFLIGALNEFPVLKLLQQQQQQENNVNTKAKETRDYLGNFSRWHDMILKRHVLRQQGQCYSKVLLILEGDGQTLLEHSRNWYSFLILRILYFDPSITKHHTQKRVSQWRLDYNKFALKSARDTYNNNKEVVSANGMLEDLVEHLLGHQYVKFLETSKSFCTLWFASHMSDMMLLFSSHCESQYIGPLTNFHKFHVRDDMIIEFASMLLSTGGTEWQLGMDYLSYCNEKGITQMNSYISNHQVTLNDAKTQQLLQICDEMGMSNEYYNICKTLGNLEMCKNRCRDEKGYAKALQWFYKCKDEKMISQTIEAILDSCSQFNSNFSRSQAHILITKLTQLDIKGINNHKLNCIEYFCILNEILRLDRDIEKYPYNKQELDVVSNCIFQLLSNNFFRARWCALILDSLYKVLHLYRKSEFSPNEVFKFDTCSLVLKCLDEMESDPLQMHIMSRYIHHHTFELESESTENSNPKTCDTVVDENKIRISNIRQSISGIMAGAWLTGDEKNDFSYTGTT